MNYRRLSNKELQEYKYPNLMAEIIESGYSMALICDRMGHENMSEEDAKKMMYTKLRGKDIITVDEAFGLAALFRGDVAYLVSTELTIEYGAPKAHWRWVDENNRIEKELKKAREKAALKQELSEKPYLKEFIRLCIDLTEEKKEKLSQLLKEMEEENAQCQ